MLEKIILQFVSGETDFSAFYQAYCEDEGILRCLEDTVTSLSGKGIPVTYDAVFRADTALKEAECGLPEREEDHRIAVPTKHHPTVRSLMDFFIGSDCSFVMKKAEIYDLIFSIAAALDPETKYYHKYADDFRFFLRAVPDYAAGGEAACNYIENMIIAKIPADLSEAKRIRLCREKIRQDFHITGNKYPRWAQSAEWPITDGRPAKYVGYRRTGDRACYLFEDVVTGRSITVEQYY